MNQSTRYHSFTEFYPFYLNEHSNPICRRLHFIGTTLALIFLIAAIATQLWWLIAVGIAQGYMFAWSGHFFFERNQPAAFQYVWFSLLSDWCMWWQILTGKIPL
jgi:hypothetical protein